MSSEEPSNSERMLEEIARLAAEVERLRGALTKIATKSPDGTGKPRPIWRSEEMAQIARAALTEGDAA